MERSPGVPEDPRDEDFTCKRYTMMTFLVLTTQLTPTLTLTQTFIYSNFARLDRLADHE